MKASQFINRVNWVWRNLLIWTHNILTLVPHPDEASALSFQRPRDEDENAKTRPPAEYEGHMQCVWAVELYTPSDLPELQAGLVKLGLADDIYLSGRDPLSFMLEARDRSVGGSWSNLGFIRKREDRRLYTNARIGPLPGQVEMASLGLYQLTPAITAIAACFFLTQKSASRPLDILREERKSKFKPLGRGYTVLTPAHLKRDELEEFRAGLRAELHEWFAVQLPGLFARSPLRRFPTCEFWIYSSAGEHAGKMDNLLGLPIYHSWSSTDWPGVRFLWPLDRTRREWFHATLAAEREVLASLDVSSYGAQPDVYPYVFEHPFGGLLVRWALLSAFAEFRARLSHQRDNRLGLPRNASKALRSMEAMILETADIDAVCNDLQDSGERNFAWQDDYAEFIESGSLRTKPERHLRAVLRDAVQAEAVSIYQMDHRLKSLALQQGNILATAQTLRLQRVVGLLTVIALFIAAVSAIEPLEKISKHFSWLLPRNLITTTRQ
jgi:hypothetical protein